MTNQRTFNTASKPTSARARSCVWNQPSGMRLGNAEHQSALMNIMFGNAVTETLAVNRSYAGKPCDAIANSGLINFNLARYRTDSLGALH
jgi:hypothetical protein